MIGVLSKIFGSGSVISEGVKLIDDLHTSTEEEILAKSQARIALLQAYAPFKIAQRYLAVLFSFTFVGSFLLVLAMTLAGKGDIPSVKDVLGDFYIGEIMLTIVFFYFGGGAVEGITDRFKTGKKP